MAKNNVQFGYTLAFYIPREELTIQCHASRTGPGAVLMQNDRPIAYASRVLSETDTRYAQIEKEMLAIVFSLGNFTSFRLVVPSK